MNDIKSNKDFDSVLSLLGDKQFNLQNGKFAKRIQPFIGSEPYRMYQFQLTDVLNKNDLTDLQRIVEDGVKANENALVEYFDTSSQEVLNHLLSVKNIGVYLLFYQGGSIRRRTPYIFPLVLFYINHDENESLHDVWSQEYLMDRPEGYRCREQTLAPKNVRTFAFSFFDNSCSFNKIDCSSFDATFNGLKQTNAICKDALRTNLFTKLHTFFCSFFYNEESTVDSFFNSLGEERVNRALRTILGLNS